MHSNATARQVYYRETAFKSTIYETEHPVGQVHPPTGERAIVLGYFVRRLLGVSSADSAHLFAVLQNEPCQADPAQGAHSQLQASASADTRQWDWEGVVVSAMRFLNASSVTSYSQAGMTG
jgi:alpha-ketoglutarate-dependent taurine dioxygenase